MGAKRSLIDNQLDEIMGQSYDFQKFGITRKDFKYTGSQSFKDIAKETYGSRLAEISRKKRFVGNRRALKNMPIVWKSQSPDIRKEKTKASIFNVDTDQEFNLGGFTKITKRRENPSTYTILLNKTDEVKQHESTHSLPTRGLPKKLSTRLSPNQRQFLHNEIKFQKHVSSKPAKSAYGFVGRSLFDANEAAAQAVPVIRNYFKQTGRTIESNSDWKKAVRRYNPEFDRPKDKRELREHRNALRRSPFAKAYGQGLY